jgi:transmembrane sensor
MTASEAAAHFVARNAEGLNQSEADLLARWLAADVAHSHEYERATRAWEAFADADDDEILAAMRNHALAPRSNPRRLWQPLAAAAAVAFLLLSVVLLVRPWSSPGSDELSAGAAVQYASAPRNVREIRLHDGSTLTLDADSAVTASISGDQRSVRLVRGRAYFGVKADADRPFHVLADRYRVTATGTQFDVSTLHGELSVTLFEGRVAVEQPGGEGAVIRLEPGEQLTVRDGRGLLRRLGPAVPSAQWRKGLLRFDDQPLGRAAEEVNRYSSEQVVISDPAVAALRVSGQFRAGEARRFAQTAADLHGLRVVPAGTRVELRR